ncbi:MAG: translocation/assembly module TamB domain-containing protein [Prevotellaceae bacterium]|nr:translocation/assembly module TamB domain-containing protein [Candidatus Faecinaster equi]
MKINKHIIKTTAKCIGWAIASPILIFLLCAIIIYIPPVQKVIKNYVCDMLSESTESTIEIENVALAFPFDLAIDKVLMTKDKDTILRARALRLNIAFLPLLEGNVDVTDFHLWNVSGNSFSMLSDIQVKGEMKELALEVPVRCNLPNHDVTLNGLLLKDADLYIALNDTAAKDTTSKEPVKWKIALQKVDITNSKIALSMPGDSMRVITKIKRGILDNGCFDLEKNKYYVKSLKLNADSIKYDLPYIKETNAGLDFNHLCISPIYCKIGSFNFNDGAVNVSLLELVMRERSGLFIRNLSTKAYLDSKKINIPYLNLKTEQSSVNAKAFVEWSALNSSKGKFDVKADAKIGKSDILLLCGVMANDLSAYLPNSPLMLAVDAHGNMGYLNLNNFSLGWDKLISFHTKGNMGNVLNNETRYGNFDYNCESDNLNNILALFTSTNPKARGIGLWAYGNTKFKDNIYNTSNKIRLGKGLMNICGQLNANSMSYNANIDLSKLPVNVFLPIDSLSTLTAQLKAKGCGFDFMSPKTKLNAQINIKEFNCGSIPLNNINLNAIVKNGQALAQLVTKNDMLDSDIKLKALLQNNIKAQLLGNIYDFSTSYITHDPDSMHIISDINIDGHYNTKKKTIEEDLGIKGKIQNINIYDKKQGLITDNINFDFNSSDKGLSTSLTTGDFNFSANSKQGLYGLMNKFTAIANTISKQIKNVNINQNEIKQNLPDMALHLYSGQNNAISRIAYLMGYSVQEIKCDMTANNISGIDANMQALKVKLKNLTLDETTLKLIQKEDGLYIYSQIQNKEKKNPKKFTAKLDGQLLNNGVSLQTMFYDEKGEKGLDLGVKAEIDSKGTAMLHLFPETSTIAYRKFKINKNNYLLLTKNLHVDADIDLLADDMTNIKLLSEPTNSDSINDITLSLSKINLFELASVFPIMPKLSGFLNGDIHVMTEGKKLSAVADVDAENFAYEGSKMGNIGANLVYIPKSSNEHYICGDISSEGNVVMQLDGTYIMKNEGFLDANVSMTDLPCNIANGFLPPDGTMALEGIINGNIDVTGPIDKLIINGDINPDSVYINSALYGFNLKVDKRPIRITNNRLHFDNMKLFASPSDALVINGDFNFEDFNNMKFNMTMNASDFEIINSKKTKTSVVYGKVNVDFDGTLTGTTNLMLIKGNLKLLNGTNMTYVMKDTPISVDDRLKDIVEFVDFEDEEEEKPDDEPIAGGMMMNLLLSVNEGAKVHCELSDDGSSYVDCNGSGDLTFKYFPSGEMSLLGTFNIISGEMKYSLPIIPLKTFKFVGDNYVSFNGNVMDPTLHITATEENKTSVSSDGENTRMVTFNVGVAITQKLSDMGLDFIIEAPSDMEIQNELAAMSKEQLNKLAISMLATGMYISTNNKSQFSSYNALNTFLQNEIQALAGNALKTTDVKIGVENSYNSKGEEGTDYSFQLAQHLWNDRVTFIIGGKVSSTKDENSSQNFIDNVSLEYRLDNGSTRYVKVFYDKSQKDPLEGLYSAAGAGLVLRKKTNNLGELFIFRRKRK